LAGALALGALFAAMARGVIGLASPIAAMGVLAPVAYGLARGESLSMLALIGATLAIVGILLAVHPGAARSGRAGVALLFAAGAALGFGAMFVGVAVAAKHNAAWAVCAARAGGCGTIGAGVLLSRRVPAVAQFDLPRLAAIGVLDVLGSGVYALASNLGRISVAAVAASLYPGVTVMLAAGVVGERLRSVQRLGVAVAVLGIAAIAAGT
jgi:drug/metabolite transporter (DMT)-like permease